MSTIDVDTGERRSYHHDTLADGVDALAAADRLVFHNGLGFDLHAVRMTTGVELDPEKIIDTLVLSRLGNPERKGGHSLNEWGARLSRAKPKHEDFSKWSPEMEHRCNEDTEITLQVYDRLKGMYDAMPKAVEIEHRTAWATSQMIRRGFGLDVPYCNELVSELLSEQEKVLADIKQQFPPILAPAKRSEPVRVLKTVNRRHALHGVLDPGVEFCPVEIEEFNPASRIQIARRLVQKHGWAPQQFTQSGQPEVSEDILRDLPYPEAKVFADYLVTKKKLAQLQAPPRSNGSGGGWLHHVSPEGRVHASLNPLRAVTGRPACSSPNVQQVDTDPRMRRAWVPRDGYKLVGWDAEGLELRCLAHYLQPLDGGAYAKMLLEGDKNAGTDVRSVCRDLLGFYDRNETKRAEYGWLYGAGNAKLGLISYQDAYKAGKEINYDHLGLTAGKKRPSNSAVGKAIRARLEEGITGLGTLVGGVKSKAKATGKLKGLDGRTLWIRSEHSALNFLLQSAGIIVMKQVIALAAPALEARGLIEDEDFATCMWVHDELQIEARPEVADEIGKTLNECIEQAEEMLGFRCPLAGAYDIGDSWADTH